MRFFDQLSDTEGQPVYTVARLNAEIREILETGYPQIAVEAEVVEVSRAASGHVYFTLGDRGGSAQIKAVMWKGGAMRYRSRIEAGKAVRCVGRVTLYEARGAFQMVVERIFEAGAGDKARMLAELKAKLFAEGLFDPSRKRPLPTCPACIGVVTSRSGAAFRDIVKVAGRRFKVRIVLAHAQVQGETAPGEIAGALDRIARVEEVEVVIVGRGGGSAEDLDAFNSELVVRKMAAHPVPVISAVGHEVDLTLADLVADRRAATPSEAAELAVPDGRALEERLALGGDALWRVAKRCVETARFRLDGWDGRLKARDPRVRLGKGIEVLSRAKEALDTWPKHALLSRRSNLDALDAGLCRWPGPALGQKRSRLQGLAATLDALSPLASLARGYAVVTRSTDNGKEIVRSHVQAPSGVEVDVRLADGSLTCKVERSSPPVNERALKR